MEAAQLGYSSEPSDAPAVSPPRLIDLSMVERFDQGAVVQLVILVEASVRSSADVEIRLPLRIEIEAEASWRTGHKHPDLAGALISRRVERRNEAYNALADYLRFEEAVLHSHIGELPGKVSITSRAPDWTALPESVLPETDEESLAVLPIRSAEYWCPLTWIQTGEDFGPGAEMKVNSKAVQLAADRLWDVFSRTIAGPASVSADLTRSALADIILKELIENVLVHAGRCRWALVGGSALLKEDLAAMPDDWFLSCDRGFISWYRQAGEPLMEVHVADAGPGVVTTLRPTFERYEVATANRVLQWAFERYTTSNHRQPHSTGLHRVDQVARRRRGMVTIRSEGGYGGWDHGGPAFDQRVGSQAELAHFPGSAFRIRLPLGHQPLQLHRDTAQANNRVDVKVFERLANVSQPIPDETIGKIREHFATPRHGNLGILLLIFDPAQTGIPLSPRELLAPLASLPDKGVIACYGLPATWGSEDPKSGVNGVSDGSMDDNIPQVVILSPGGGARWFDGPPSVRKVLGALLESAKKLSPTELGEIAGTDADAVIQQLATAGHLVSKDRHRHWRLNFSLTDIWREIGKKFTARLEALPPQQPQRYVRTPSLVVSRRWFKPNDLFPVHPEGAGQPETCYRAAHSLALALKAEEHPATRNLGPRVELLTDAGAEANVAFLARALGIKKYHSISGEGDEPSLADGPVIPDEPDLFIFTDILYSGETAGRLVRQAFRDGARPVLVLAYVNAREKKGPLDALGAKIPVVALAELDVAQAGPVPEDLVDNISPISREEEGTPRDWESATFQPAPLDEILEEAQAIHLGHTGEANGRHFTFYLNPARILASMRVRKEMLDRIDAWRQKTGGAGAKVALLFSESTHVPSVGELCEWIQREAPWVAGVDRVFREKNDGQFRLGPAVLSNPLAAPLAVIVDWGVMTGTSLRHLIRIAVQRDASHVLAYPFISQLSEEENEFLSMLSALRKPAKTDVESNVSITILSEHRFSTGFYSSDTCPVCRHGRELNQDTGRTALLKNFAREEVDRIALVDRDDRLKEWPTGEATELSWMVKFRGLLDSARQYTGARWEVARLLSQLSKAACTGKPPDEALWLIRLLVTETQWLRRPPLHFDQCRDSVAEIAEAVIYSSASLDRYRAAAIGLLRAAAKTRFAAQFGKLFELAHRSPALCTPLLHHASTYVSRPYHRGERMLKPLAEPVSEVVNLLRHRKLQASPEVADSVRHLHQVLQRELAESEIAQLPLHEAWVKFRKNYEFHYDRTRSHRTLAENFARIRPPRVYLDAVNEIVLAVESKTPPKPGHLITLRETWFNSIVAHWEPCRDFLDKTVFPYLEQITVVLDGYDAKLKIGAENINRLLRIARHVKTADEDELSRILRDFAAAPERSLTRHNWERFESMHRWLEEVVFQCREGEDGELVRSRLWDFLDSAPTDLADQVMKLYPRWRDAAPADLELSKELVGLVELRESRPQVLCPGSLVRDLVNQVLDNTVKHRVPDRAAGVWIDHDRPSEGRFRLMFFNRGTEPSPPEQHGYGLQSLRQRLEAFGGRVIVNARRHLSPNTTFSIDIEFTEIKNL